MESLEVFGDENLMRRIAVMGNRFQNMILDGPNDTLKSSFVKTIIRNSFPGGVAKEHNFLNISMLCDRSVKDIRSRLKTFCNTTIDENDMKIIVIDKFELLTNEIQFSLRRMIENYSHKVRFIFKCSTKFKIIDPILSRCVVVYFRHVPIEVGKNEENEDFNIESLFREKKNVIDVYKLTNALRNECVNYEHYVESILLWVLRSDRIDKTTKLDIIQMASEILGHIIGMGNPVLNITNLIYFIYNRMDVGNLCGSSDI